MRPDDMQNWMLKLADAATGETHNLVFVMRQVLTAAYTQGFEDGHRATSKDEFVRDQIDRKKREEGNDRG